MATETTDTLCGRDDCPGEEHCEFCWAMRDALDEQEEEDFGAVNSVLDDSYDSDIGD